MNEDQIKLAILSAFYSQNISGYEKDILMLLAGYGVDPWPSQEHIAYECGCSVSTIKRALNRLREIGWITQDQT